MPVITINGHNVDVETGKRLVLAVEDSGIRIGHRCGGKAKCTTCRVEFEQGEPETMTEAEYNRLKTRDLIGQVRLSCQIVCDHDMSVHPLQTAETMPEWEGDTGPRPQPFVEPEAKWYPIEELRQQAEE